MPQQPKDPKVEAEIQRLPEFDIAELRRRWKSLYGRPAPPSFRRNLLISGLAYKIRINAYGDLSPAMKRRLRDIAQAIRNGTANAVIGTPILKPGTQLIRRWKGETLSVTVLEGGFAWEGRTYRSLSATAKAITGTSWNGHKFFGIRPANQSNKHAAGPRRSNAAAARHAKPPASEDYHG
ncbi:MAG: DUF2924 domain-containing protein [Afipia sp.]|nr:DUF2924 domain-containing protein [Afipia sp.]